MGSGNDSPTLPIVVIVAAAAASVFFCSTLTSVKFNNAPIFLTQS